MVADGGIGAVLRVVDGAVVVVDGVVKFGSSGAGGGATTVCCCELLTMTSAITRPMTITTDTAASAHSHMRGPRPFGIGWLRGRPAGWIRRTELIGWRSGRSRTAVVAGWDSRDGGGW